MDATGIIDLGRFFELLNKGGVIALLAFNLWAFVTGQVVPKWVHREKSEDCDRWRTTAMQATENADRALLMLEQLRSERSSRT